MQFQEVAPSIILALALGLTASRAASDTFRVATYNLESYLEAPVSGRPAKSPESRAQIRHHIRESHADVLALQELGSPAALEDLRQNLRADGVDFPHSAFASGSDTNIHIAVLSRFPFSSCQAWTNLSFLLGGRRFHVSRGLLEIDCRVTPRYSFTLLVAHLKSRRAVPQADEAELRWEEAKVLRERIDQRLNADPDLNLVVLGDFNDTRNSPVIKTILGRGKSKLLDTRPPERNPLAPPGDQDPRAPRNITWTHYYALEDTYSRIDYILLSAGMAHEWSEAGSCVVSLPNWGVASDHRPVVAEFEASDQ